MILQTAFKKRLLATLVLITFLFVVVISKLFFVQIIDGEDLRARALDQWTRDVPLKAERGGIFDRNGILLAGTTTSYTCYVRPSNVTDAARCAEVISNTTGISYEKLLSKISARGSSELTIAKKLTKEAVNLIMESGVNGVYFSKDISRYYPYGSFASQVLGFCDSDTQGQAGIEQYYNEYLKGTNGSQLTETDIIGRELSDTIYYIPSVSGINLCLSLDKNIQFFAESAVQNALLQYNALCAGCIVADLQTGGIAALAQAPSFDLNNIDRSNVNALFDSARLSSVCNVYETGSVFKIITIAAALEEGVVHENESFFCSGSRMVDGQRIKCWKTRGHASQTFAEGVKNSCNCVFMDLALRVGLKKMYEYYRKFNLTAPTGLDFSGEGQGLLIPLETAKTVDLARMGFGQAIAVTPLELVTAVSSILGGGIMRSPYILASAYDKDGKKVFSRAVNEGIRVVSEKTSETVRRLLLGVVADGSGRLAGVSGYNVGGKTGTAQKYKNGIINRGKYLSSFIGYCTYESPRYVVYFYVDEPQGYLYYGSQVAAPYVGQIFSEILTYENIQPQAVEDKRQFLLPDFCGLTYSKAKVEASKLGIYLETEGDGETVSSQFPYPGTEVTENCVLFLKYD